MIARETPPWRIDPRTLPPPLLTSERGSFARHTVETRIPQIIEDAKAADTWPPEILAALEALRREISGGVIQPLRGPAPDVAFWNDISSPYLGRAWLDVPWFWAETFFYRRLLEATGYFRPGPWEGRDPFGTRKSAELAPDEGPARMGVLLRSLPDDPGRRCRSLLLGSLWANRLDLSYPAVARLGRESQAASDASRVLGDDSARLVAWLERRQPGPMALVADNAGAELLMDLALADFLLTARLVDCLAVHVKPQPFFVSDAMAADVVAALDSLRHGGESTRALSERLSRALLDGRLVIRTHWWYAACFFYFQMPDDLHDDLARMDLVLLKGDLNYRRLLGDAHWPPTTTFVDAVAYFPAPLVTLRTLKSEIVVGLRPGTFERLQSEEPGWRVDGRWGLIQARL